MPTRFASPARFAFAAFLLSLAPAVSRAAEPVFLDSFDGRDVTRVASHGRFWTVVQPDSNPDSEVANRDGQLHLRAANWAHTYAGVVSPALPEFGFFARPITVSLDDLLLKADGIADSDARFKLSFAATSERAERAADAISLRIRPGLLLFGYRVDGFEPGNSPENLSGQKTKSVVAEPLAGVPTKLSLTLGPGSAPGTVRFEIRASGNGADFTRVGTFPLTPDQWGKDAAALVIDVRRDDPATSPGTGAELSVGQITVTR